MGHGRRRATNDGGAAFGRRPPQRLGPAIRRGTAIHGRKASRERSPLRRRPAYESGQQPSHDGRAPQGLNLSACAPAARTIERLYFFMLSRSFIHAVIPARHAFSSTPSGKPATPTPPTSFPSTASGTPPPTR